jgi:hypothetical protein
MLIGHKKGYRPGVMCNMLLDEYQNGKYSSDDKYFVINVTQHKTGTIAPAGVSLTEQEHTMFQRFATCPKIS